MYGLEFGVQARVEGFFADSSGDRVLRMLLLSEFVRAYGYRP